MLHSERRYPWLTQSTPFHCGLACSSCDFQRMAVQIKFISTFLEVLCYKNGYFSFTGQEPKVKLSCCPKGKGKLVDHLRSLCALCTAYVRPPYGLYTAYKLSEIGRGTLKRLHGLYGFDYFSTLYGPYTASLRPALGHHTVTMCSVYTAVILSKNCVVEATIRPVYSL